MALNHDVDSESRHSSHVNDRRDMNEELEDELRIPNEISWEARRHSNAEANDHEPANNSLGTKVNSRGKKKCRTMPRCLVL